ncbi:MAG: alpha/beta hydrolase [Planctomycetes bacterium]|nr:alpha/beta hydrolase [Planctomycetota bacterium]
MVGDIEQAGLDRVVLVGHSLAGIALPGVAARLAKRIKHLVFSSCSVAADGDRPIDLLRPDVQDILKTIRRAATRPIHRGVQYNMPILHILYKP